MVNTTTLVKPTAFFLDADVFLDAAIVFDAGL
jgi:hypothetical protein